MTFWMYEFDLSPSSYQIFFYDGQIPHLKDIPLNTRAFHYAERKYEKSALLTVVNNFSQKKDTLAIAMSKLEVLEYCYQWMTDFEQERVAYREHLLVAVLLFALALSALFPRCGKNNRQISFRV
ncbi:hypothetical protein CEXT_434231 [Caerostris extrusa]|uniref:Uncharacterized protein n=1 Tax=Caerostris extrusa TaxID=172846 RepID=A0AAV4Y2N0_CAEEX|nr:hypothetical protein CEXT_434231 [Caerostris extrusa]